MKHIISLCFMLCLALPGLAQTKRTTLDIYYVDVEGGAATLIVTPAGESILVDAGWPGFEYRDAKRIEVALKQAGITQIDHFIMTHYHVDHYGGIPQLAERVKIMRFYDRGPLTEDLKEYKDNPKAYADYRKAANDKTTTLKPRDTIALKQAKGFPAVNLQIIASSRATIVGKVSANPACDTTALQAEDPSDNARSVAFKLSYGDFEFYDAGDLTWNIEHKLACPGAQLAPVDLYQVTHHGMNTSNNTALLQILQPTVAIMNNGPRKGGSADVIKNVRALPSLKAFYQVHRNITLSAEQNAPEEFIANLEAQDDKAHMITVAVDAKKKSFAVTNGRTGVSKSFAIK